MKRNKPIKCCELLRAKTIYYQADERPGMLHENKTHSHWCLKTQSPVGPDDCEARPPLCQPGRPCYKED